MTATDSSSGSATAPQDLIYGLDDRPAPLPALFAALQHVLASFVGVITPPSSSAVPWAWVPTCPIWSAWRCSFPASAPSSRPSASVRSAPGCSACRAPASAFSAPSSAPLHRQGARRHAGGNSRHAVRRELLRSLRRDRLQPVHQQAAPGDHAGGDRHHHLPDGPVADQGGDDRHRRRLWRPDLGALPNLALAGLVIGIIVVLNRFPGRCCGCPR